MSAVGKSTSLAELASRGHTVVDADEDGYTEETIVERLLRQSATYEIDTQQPLSTVVDSLERVAVASR